MRDVRCHLYMHLKHMTWYPKSLIDPCPGLLEQLLVCVVAQRLTNRKFRANAFTTDFVADSIRWSTKTDFEQVNTFTSGAVDISVDIKSTMELTVSLPRGTSDQWVLQDIPGGDMTPIIFSANISAAEIPFMQIGYPRRSPLAKVPAYLSDFTSDNYKITNTLERRIAFLFLQVKAYKDFELQYIQVKNVIAAYDFALSKFIDVPDDFDLASRDAAIVELNNLKIIYQSEEPFPLDRFYPVFGLPPIGNVGGGENNSATAQNNDFGINDPLSDNGALSDQIKELLDSNDSGSSFGSSVSEQNSAEQKESTTLESC